MQFYVIEKKPSGDEAVELYRTDFHFDEKDTKGDAPKCPDCGSFIGLLTSLPPYHVHLETWGEDFGDLAFWMHEILVSRRFRDEFIRSGLKGISAFEPVEILSQRQLGGANRKHLEPPEYFRVYPKLGGAQIDLKASSVEWRGNAQPTCKRCLNGGVLKRWKHVIVDEKSWAGDDVFYAFGIPGVLLVSLRFFDWAQKHQFRNLIMNPAIECSRDFYP